MKAIDRTGQRFGRLVIQRQYSSRNDGDKRARTRCVCVCDCGKTIDTVIESLIAGKTTSCGCYWLEKVSTHGVSDHPLFPTWRNMMYRCYKPDVDSYPSYGGRGITVCERWHDPRNFIADMDPKPDDSYSLDRIDNDGPYSPENCRWATLQQQGRNKRKKIQIGDEAHGITEWCETLDVNRVTYWARRKRGLSPFESLMRAKGKQPIVTLETALRIRQRYLSDTSLSMYSLADEYGIARGTVYNILHAKHVLVRDLPPIKTGRGKHR